MEPPRRDFHWQPLDANEREALFDRIEAFLAGQQPAPRPGAWPDPPAPTPDEIRAWWEQEQRERRFYQADPEAYERARQLPPIPDEPVRTAEPCPDCGSPTLWRSVRTRCRGPLWCPNCGWDEVPF